MFSIIKARDGLFVRHALMIRSSAFSAVLPADTSLPLITEIDVHAKQGSFCYRTPDGNVVLAWNERTVTVEMPDVRFDTRILNVEIVKTDDSLPNALKEWLSEAHLDDMQNNGQTKRRKTNMC